MTQSLSLLFIASKMAQLDTGSFVLLVLTAAVAIPLSIMGILAIVLKNTRLSTYFLPSPPPPQDRLEELRSLRAIEGHTRRSMDANERIALVAGRSLTQTRRVVISTDRLARGLERHAAAVERSADALHTLKEQDRDLELVIRRRS